MIELKKTTQRGEFICPNCGSQESSVRDSRLQDNGRYRRRECLGCGDRYSTFESLAPAALTDAQRAGLRTIHDQTVAFTATITAAVNRITSGIAIVPEDEA